MEVTHHYDVEAMSMIPHAASGFTFRVTRCHQFANHSLVVGEAEIYTLESYLALSPYTLSHPDLLPLKVFLTEIGLVPHFIPSTISAIERAIPREFISPARGVFPWKFFSYFNMSVTLYIFSTESVLDPQISLPLDVDKEGDPCSICLEDIHDSPQTTLSCSHVFHIPCIVRWLGSGSATCPLCRNSVDLLT